MARRDAGDGEAGALDPALTQKKRARRRLVGALVLGLAAVIVLLEIFISSYTERWSMVLGGIYIAVTLFAPLGIVGLVRNRGRARVGQ